MGYSTTLYAVDLDSLKAAVGSGDAGLLDRVHAAEAADGPKEVDPTRGPRLKVTLDGDLLLNGHSVSLAELRGALQKPEWKGTNLYLYYERGHKRRPVPSAFEIGQALGPGTVAGILTCNTEQEFLAGWQDDALSDEQALRELISGEFTHPDCAHQYGYALERLCGVFGVRLGTIPGKGRLKALKVETPLCETRCPVRLPASRDAPYISYLTAGEVCQEVERLDGMDLSFPKNAAIEQDRRMLLYYLRSAAQQGRGVVAFYY